MSKEINSSIQAISETTTSDRVRYYAKCLSMYADKRIRLSFIKKNGKIRDMVCIPRNTYNKVFAIPTTVSGRKMVATKVKRNMATVCEVIDDGTLRPRTINLDTIVGTIEIL
jgi:hypothetical protein